ncbi:MCE family protein [Mycolicibacterium vaccae]|uniref:MCE family protein n=1 Tax=Mycolicibacterium vaccae TaxID=1810 RepID=UPI003D05896E
MENRRVLNLRPEWWALILVVTIALVFAMTAALYTGWFNRYVPVILTSDRAGLVMEAGGRVKLRGVEVGRVKSIRGGAESVSLQLDLYPDQVRHIPANVEARIRATTAFGAKYVDLIVPDDPSPKRVAAGAVLRSQNVSTEVNTVFQNLTSVLQQIDPPKLNAILATFAEALRGQGARVGEATSAANEVLLAVNPRADQLRRDWQSIAGFSDTYSAAAQDIIDVLDAASTTSDSVTSHAQALDALLLSVTGFSRSGIDLLAPSKDQIIGAVNILEPTTALLLKYSPTFTCMIVGGHWALENGLKETFGANGRTEVIDIALLPGKEPYKYPNHLPVIGAKGGPGGKPSCGSLPFVDNNWPVRQLITNTGWGTGLDIRPNPGIGFPGYANYFPATRAVPEPPSVRNPGGPAVGPIPYPGAPPYGAQLYGPDGTPLYPGLPPAPPPGAPREAGPPPPGSEPFMVPHPAQVQPTPAPRVPVPAIPGQ